MNVSLPPRALAAPLEANVEITSTMSMAPSRSPVAQPGQGPHGATEGV